eukprot:7319296-Prorocentrum_lima.AAC.1
MYFKKCVAPVRAVVVVDAAYRSNEDKKDCLALPRYLVAVVGSQQSRSLHAGGHCYVLDVVSKKFNTVARSSFAAEPRNQLEAAQS